MGYYSTFSGSIVPSKPLTQELVTRINDSACGLCVADEYSDSDGDPGDIVPVSREMKGYDIVQELFRIQHMLEGSGIKLTGEINRTGESDGDFEKLEAVNGRIYVRSGEVRYGKRRRITADDVAKYSIKVYRTGKQKKGGDIFAGWLGVTCGKRGEKYVLLSDTGGAQFDRLCPPMAAATFRSKEAASQVIRAFKTHGHRCELVTWGVSL